jgi:hypothetical protein
VLGAYTTKFLKGKGEPIRKGSLGCWLHVQIEYQMGSSYERVTSLEQRRREALQDLPVTDLINISLLKYR